MGAYNSSENIQHDTAVGMKSCYNRKTRDFTRVRVHASYLRGATPGVGQIRQSLSKHKPTCMISTNFCKSKYIPGFKPK